jgi:hypothetical protein
MSEHRCRHRRKSSKREPVHENDVECGTFARTGDCPRHREGRCWFRHSPCERCGRSKKEARGCFAKCPWFPRCQWGQKCHFQHLDFKASSVGASVTVRRLRSRERFLGMGTGADTGIVHSVLRGSHGEHLARAVVERFDGTQELVTISRRSIVRVDPSRESRLVPEGPFQRNRPRTGPLRGLTSNVPKTPPPVSTAIYPASWHAAEATRTRTRLGVLGAPTMVGIRAVFEQPQPARASAIFPVAWCGGRGSGTALDPSMFDREFRTHPSGMEFDPWFDDRK